MEKKQKTIKNLKVDNFSALNNEPLSGPVAKITSKNYKDTSKIYTIDQEEIILLWY